MTLEQSEKLKYEQMWAKPGYGAVCHSWNLFHSHRHLFPNNPESFLDIGCGPGMLVPLLCGQSIYAMGIDITLSGLCELARMSYQYQFVEMPLWKMGPVYNKFHSSVCADVMEHIPPEHVHESLLRVSQACRHCVFKIDHEPDVSGGGILHLTLQPPEWWVEQINNIAKEARLIERIRGGDGTMRASIIVWDMRKG